MTIEIMNRDVLLVLDIQNDFCPGGALAVRESDLVIPVINDLMPSFAHIVLTQDWHPPGHLSFASSYPGRKPFATISMAYGEQVLWPDHCVQGTEGAAFHRDLDISKAELILRKGFHPEIDSYSAFRENDRKTKTGLAGYLRERGLERVFVLGLAYDYCVRYSAVDATMEGFTVFVVEDGCRAIGSTEATRQEFASRGVHSIQSGDIVA